MIQILYLLLRPRLALLNGIAAAGGYLLFPGGPSLWPLAGALAGVTLLAAAGSAFNQLQERDLDLLMARTRQRPLPNGDLSPTAAAVIGGVCLLAGLLVISLAGGLLPTLLGVTALAWYLGLYTPLKRRTPFALAVGGVCGAIPPVIGWCCAGGTPADFRIMLLACLLYLWQIPHFWLFQRRHAEEYRSAGIPLFEPQLAGIGNTGICRLWLVALIAGAMLLPALGIISRHASPWYAAVTLGLLIFSLRRSDTAAFTCLNLFPLLVTLTLILQR